MFYTGGCSLCRCVGTKNAEEDYGPLVMEPFKNPSDRVGSRASGFSAATGRSGYEGFGLALGFRGLTL